MFPHGDKPIILDGAMGSLLAERGCNTALPLWSARALLDCPEAVLQVHLDYLRAGARVITTNTFRTHQRSLAKAGIGERAEELTRLAVELAQRAVREFAAEQARNGGRDARATETHPTETRPTDAHRADAHAADIVPGAPLFSREAQRSAFSPLIAGCISPLEDCYRPDLAPGFYEALPEHRAMANHLAEAGVDLLLIETMPAWNEAQAALAAARETGLPVWLSLHTSGPGVLLSGEELTACLAALHSLPEAVLVNCIPAQRALDDVRLLRTHVPSEIPIGVYANTGHVDPIAGWSSADRMGPQRYADLAVCWRRDAGASIIGGCCGTTPPHIAALAARLGYEDHLRP